MPFCSSSSSAVIFRFCFGSTVRPCFSSVSPCFFFFFFFLGFAAFYRVSAIDAKIRSPKSKRSSYNRVTGFYWVFFSFAGRSGGGGGRKRNCKLKKKGGGAWTAGPGGGSGNRGETERVERERKVMMKKGGRSTS